MSRASAPQPPPGGPSRRASGPRPQPPRTNPVAAALLASRPTGSGSGSASVTLQLQPMGADAAEDSRQNRVRAAGGKAAASGVTPVKDWSPSPSKNAKPLQKPLTLKTGLIIGACVLLGAVLAVVAFEVSRPSGKSSTGSGTGTSSSDPNTPGTGSGGSSPKAPTLSPELAQASLVLGTSCNAMTGAGCNPHQLAVTKPTQPPVWPSAASSVSTPAAQGFVKTPINSFSMQDSSGLIGSVTQYSTSTANGFGIGGSFPVSGVSFGGGYSAKQVFKNLESSTEKTYTARMDAVMETTQISYDPSYPLAASPTLAADIREVVIQGRSINAWKRFANKHGTHYVSSVTYGGVISSFSQLKVQGTSYTSSELSTHTESLKLGFASFADLSASHSTSSGSSSTQAQQQWQGSSTLSVRGGEPALAATLGTSSEPQALQDWIQSVTQETSVVTGTTLTTIAALFPVAHQVLATTMLRAIVSECPSSTDNPLGARVACNGVGRCNFEIDSTDTCVCPPDQLGASCNVTHIPCTSYCINGICDYSTGKCDCEFQWTGPSCDIQCGIQNYGSGTLGNNYAAQVQNGDDESGEQRQQAGDCACQTLMGNDQAVALMGAPGQTAVAGNGATDGSYNAVMCNGAICTDSKFYGSLGCQFFSGLSCYVPGYMTCPTEN